MIEKFKPELWEPLISMGLEMHRESSYRDVSFNENKIRSLLAMPNVACFLYKKDEKYIGFLLAQVSPYYFSDEVAARDIAFFVKPEYRGNFAAVRLVKALEDWALSQGVNDVFIAQSSGVDIEKTTDFFGHLGYENLGSCTKKRINHV